MKVRHLKRALFGFVGVTNMRKVCPYYNMLRPGLNRHASWCNSKGKYPL